ncbi:MAG: hotdog fold thioesterase [Chloroflexi bacterium AL-W]|nr:hotdog fold thioesterase [Chloroflexi bacterium AL-N1]NOK67832.1 hotdog fold thioesterase [Chloroflexi bacterium AL-N10]NOK75399.1 hotdog fold thioesterase [Chloroflexi bacterium AL-N5]NOK82187.1 hotdog fold thioesterase [Chloroflexi bacterium AL-W]NOK90032.1 hotdog fold thioesterase [Chloroflexi bacterium AL-N15]
MGIDFNLLQSKDSLDKTLGIVLQDVSSDQVVATMPVTPQHHQPFGYLHGGASVALAETVASVGAVVSCPSGKTAFGLEINANHIRPKRTGMLTAIGVPLHKGRTTQIWEVKIQDEDEKLICVSRCTLAVIDLE